MFLPHQYSSMWVYSAFQFALVYRRRKSQSGRLEALDLGKLRPGEKQYCSSALAYPTSLAEILIAIRLCSDLLGEVRGRHLAFGYPRLCECPLYLIRSRYP